MNAIWNIIAPFSCAVTAVALQVIAYNLGKEYTSTVRYLVTGLTIIFGCAFIALGPGNLQLEHAAVVVFAAIAALAVTITVIQFRQSRVDPKVIYTAVGAMVILLLVWLLGSCGSTERKAAPPKAEPPAAVTRPSDEEEDLQNRYMPQ